MPPYPEKQSPLLVRLKQKKPLMEAEGNAETPTTPSTHTEDIPKLAVNVPPQQVDQQNGLLVSLDTNDSNGYYDQSPPTTTTAPPPPTSSTTTKSIASESTKKFLFKNSDIIFENDLLQIGIKAESNKNVLRLEFYYGNKTNSNLSNITTNIDLPGELESGLFQNTCSFFV